ncbi:hypothetical protein C8R43DRAFT_1234078 [Mycena crocata]|nr:hypothetical protein C8R43DRAFT_1234078 [Mycena crocata]
MQSQGFKPRLLASQVASQSQSPPKAADLAWLGFKSPGLGFTAFWLEAKPSTSLVLATLSSLSFPDSFGHDLMHLAAENNVKNLLDFWTGNFKGLDEGKEEYQLEPAVIDEIGSACVTAGDTIPASFGARVPNIATQRHYFTAESYTLWTTLLGPVLLHGRFKKPKYYKHFLQLVEIFNDCLKFSIDRDYVDTELRMRIADWVQTYEKYYYQYDPARLSTCTLTLHALLHIPDDILNAGPMWCYWNYVTERFVGFLVRSSKSRKNPYASFARRLREIAQNNAIKVKYQLRDTLDLSDRSEEDIHGHRLVEYPGLCVLRPRITAPLDPQVQKAVRNYLLRTFVVTEAEYSHDVDKNRNRRHLPVLLERQVAYGQLLRIVEFFANLPSARDDNGKSTEQARMVLLAVIRPVNILAQSQRLGTPYYQDNKFAPIEVIDVDDISCLVARIPAPGNGPRRWALGERSDAMGASEDGVD